MRKEELDACDRPKSGYAAEVAVARDARARKSLLEQPFMGLLELASRNGVRSR
jgi:hypothetical protein